MGWDDIHDPKDNQESSKLRTWDQYLFKFIMFLFIFILAFIISLIIFATINIAGHSPSYMDGIGFVIVLAFYALCVIAIPLILSFLVVYFRTEKGGVVKGHFTTKWEYLLPICIAGILGLMATL